MIVFNLPCVAVLIISSHCGAVAVSLLVLLSIAMVVVVCLRATYVS